MKSIEKKIAEMERELIRAREQYSLLKSSLILRSNESNNNNKRSSLNKKQPNCSQYVNFILNGKACCIPQTDIIYLSDLVDSIAKDKPSTFGNNYKLSTHGQQEFGELYI